MRADIGWAPDPAWLDHVMKKFGALRWRVLVVVRVAKRPCADPSVRRGDDQRHHRRQVGSPLLDEKAEVVGLMFDGNIHSLDGAYDYDASLNRAVAVDSAAMLEARDPIHGAKALLKELEPR